MAASGHANTPTTRRTSHGWISYPIHHSGGREQAPNRAIHASLPRCAHILLCVWVAEHPRERDDIYSGIRMFGERLPSACWGSSVDEIRGGVDLADAIEALRGVLVQAMWDGQKSRVRFRVEPVELTVQVGVIRTGKGAAGVKWHILTAGGERSRRLESTQTLRIRLTPVLFDETGRELAIAEQLVIDRVGDETSAPADRASREPA